MRITKALLAVLLFGVTGCQDGLTQLELTAPSEVPLLRGSRSSFEILVHGGTGDATARIVGLPSSVTSHATPNPAGLVIEFISDGSASASSTYLLEIAVARGAATAQLHVALVISEVSISAPSTVQLLRDGSTEVTIEVKNLDGFVISVDGRPAGVVAEQRGATIHFTVTDTPIATYPVTINVSKGAIQASTTLELEIVDFSIDVVNELEVLANATARLTVHVTAFGYSAPITVRATPVMSASATISGSGAVELTLPGVGIPADDFTLFVTATAGGVVRTREVHVQVRRLTLTSASQWSVVRGGTTRVPVTFEPQRQPSGPITLEVLGPPLNVTADASPTTAEVVLTAEDAATVETTNVTLVAHTALGDVDFPVALRITDLSLNVPSTIVVPRGGRRALPITVDRQNGFEGPIELTLLCALPSCSVISAPPIAADASAQQVIVAVDTSTSVGQAQPLTIVAGFGGATRTATISLLVGDFAIAPRESVNVASGTTQLSVSLARQQGYDDDVVLTLSQLPAGVTAMPITIAGTQGTDTFTLDVDPSANCTQQAVTITGAAGGLTRTAQLLLTVLPHVTGGTPVRLAARSGRPALAAVEDTCPGIFAPVPVGDGGVVEFTVGAANGRYVLLTHCNGATLHYATVAERSSGAFDCGVLLPQSHPSFIAHVTGATPGQRIEVATPLFARSANAPTGSATVQPLFAHSSSVTDLAATSLTTAGQTERATRVFIGRDVSIDGGVAAVDLTTGVGPINDPVTITWPAGGSYFIGEYLDLGARAVTLATEYDSAPPSSSWVGLAPPRAALRSGEHLVISASTIAPNGDVRSASASSRQQPLPALTFGAAVGDGGVALAPGGVFDVTLPDIGDERSATIQVPGQMTLTIVATPGAVPLGTTLRTPPLGLLVPEFTPKWAPDSGVVQWSVTQTEAPQFYTSPIDGKLFKSATKNGTSQP